jgi:hypothetical protein
MPAPLSKSASLSARNASIQKVGCCVKNQDLVIVVVVFVMLPPPSYPPSPCAVPRPTEPPSHPPLVVLWGNASLDPPPSVERPGKCGWLLLIGISSPPQMCANRKKFIVESPSLTDTVAPPLPLLIVNSANNTTWTRLIMRGKLWWMRGQFSSNNINDFI